MIAVTFSNNLFLFYFLQAIAKKVAGGKLSMGAYGNLGTVPYLDQL